MPRKLVTAPIEEPVTPDEAMAQLRIDQEGDANYDDNLTYIASLITTARKHCESFQGRLYCTQTWDLYLDEFPDEIELPGAPLQSVTWVKYKDQDGVIQTLDSDEYVVDTVSEPGRIVLAYGEVWPMTLDEIQAVQVRYIAGYGAPADVPETAKQAILLKITDLYEHRGDDAVDPAIEERIEGLLYADRIMAI